ncbi:MAG: hypothetical protein AAFY02_16200 [Pseudomonadota bacterium]
MREGEKTGRKTSPGGAASPVTLAEQLRETYGDQLEDQNLSEAQELEFLLALWQIMQAFVDLGFSIKPGDNFTPDSAHGFDDVLDCLILEDTAHETGALPNEKITEKQP